jgi:enamine deaminase RidA (YjgF/YER057c/UK114 family)
MAFTLINPESLGNPHGYSNGLLTDSAGKLLFIAGQIAWDKNQRVVSEDFVEQFDQALANVTSVVTEAGWQFCRYRTAGYLRNQQDRISQTSKRGRRTLSKTYGKTLPCHGPS